MTYGIIIASKSKSVRRIVVSDDSNYDYSLHVGPGEEHVIADKKLGTDIFAARAAVEQATGQKSPEPLVAVVKDGLVVGLALADPLLDAVDGHELIPAYAGVAEGQTYDKGAGTFTAPLVVIPAGIDRFGKPFPEKTIGGPVEKPI